MLTEFRVTVLPRPKAVCTLCVYGDEENGKLSTLEILIGINQKRVLKNMGISKLESATCAVRQPPSH